MRLTGVVGQCSTEESLNELIILANELGIDVGVLYGVCIGVVVLAIVALFCLRKKMGVPATTQTVKSKPDDESKP